MRVVLIVALVVGSLVGIGGQLALRSPAEPVHAGGRSVGPLWTNEVCANGVVEGARPEVALRPEVAGAIAVLHVRENQDVTAGVLLAELHNETQQHQVALAEAELAHAEAQLERLRNGEHPEKRKALAATEEAKQAIYLHAKADADRSRRLIGNKSSSQQEYDADHFRVMRAKGEWEEARAQRALVDAPPREDEMAMAQAQVRVARARLRLAGAELAKTRLLAPCDGRILQLYAEPGEMAGPASPQPILHLADLSRRRVRAFVEELDATRVQDGQRAVVTVDGLPGKEFPGRVAVVLSRMGKRAPQSDEPGEYKDLYYRQVLIDLEKADELPLNHRVQARIEVTPTENGR